jgi:hypothetical protein
MNKQLIKLIVKIGECVDGLGAWGVEGLIELLKTKKKFIVTRLL